MFLNVSFASLLLGFLSNLPDKTWEKIVWELKYAHCESILDFVSSLQRAEGAGV